MTKFKVQVTVCPQTRSSILFFHGADVLGRGIPEKTHCPI